jgi:hypothetical protein
MNREELEERYSSALERYANEYPEQYNDGSAEYNLFIKEVDYYDKELQDTLLKIKKGKPDSLLIQHKINCENTLFYLNEILSHYDSSGLRTANKLLLEGLKLNIDISKIEIVELALALNKSNCIKGTQKDTIEFLSRVFNVSIPNPTRTVQAIGQRNNGSETLFLRKLQESMNE